MSKLNKENNQKNRKYIYIEETPTPKIKKKVLTSKSYNSNNNLIQKKVNTVRKILDTPTSSQQQVSSQKRIIKKLLDPNYLAEELPGDDTVRASIDVYSDETIGANDTYITKRVVKTSKKSNRHTIGSENKVVDLFKPKLIENQIEQYRGCDDSFETLKRREQISNRKIVRLSEIDSLLTRNDITKRASNECVDATAVEVIVEHEDEDKSTKNHQLSSKTFNFNSFTCSLTQVTKDSYNENCLLHLQQSNRIITSPTNTIPASTSEKTSVMLSTSSSSSSANISQLPPLPVKTQSQTSTVKTYSFVELLLDDSVCSTKVIENTIRSSNVAKSLDKSNLPSQPIESQPIETTAINTYSFIEQILDDTNKIVENSSNFEMSKNQSLSKELINCKNLDKMSSTIIQTQLYSNNLNKLNNDVNILDNKYTRVDINKEKAYSHKKKFYITYTNLTKMQLKILKQIIENNFKSNTKIEKLFNIKTTHIVIGNFTSDDALENNQNYNAKILLAMLNNCKLVKFDWVLQSSNEKNWLNEIDYLPNEFKGLISRFMKFKFEQNYLNVFSTYDNIYVCQSSIKASLREQLVEILIKLSAHVTSRPNKATLVVIGDEKKCDFNCLIDKNVPIVKYEWILDCAWKLENLNINDYLIQYT